MKEEWRACCASKTLVRLLSGEPTSCPSDEETVDLPCQSLAGPCLHLLSPGSFLDIPKQAGADAKMVSCKN